MSQFEPSQDAPSAPPTTDSGCPPPLEWQEVLREFHRQSDAWYLDRPNYRISGRTLGSGPPLYLLNGFAGTHELSSLLVWLLRDQFRCVLFDYPVPQRGSVDLSDLADDVIAIADVCGDQSCSLFATSFGGLVALTALHRHPQRIDRAVLQAGFAHRDLSRFERLLIPACRILPARFRHVPLRAALQRHNHLCWFPPFDRTRWQFYLDNTGATAIDELAWRGRIIRDGDLRPLLKQIEQPVLLVRSEGEGQVLTNCGDVLADALPHAAVETMNDTGQIPFLTHPHRLAKIIRPFLCPE
ncbi:MAG TPA: alpha/beta hydrolase [Planctomycetaceae bacterium]